MTFEHSVGHQVWWLFLCPQYNMHVLCTGLEAEVCYAIICYQQLLVLVPQETLASWCHWVPGDP